MELQNPVPVPFNVQPLAVATEPLAARKAADVGDVLMISDEDCKSRIRFVALEVYEHERSTSIWHKNLCGDRASNNLLYKFICKIHGPGHHEAASPARKDSKSSSPRNSFGKSTAKSTSPPTCYFLNQRCKPCELPYLDPQQLVNLAYFDCLFYVTVAKIRELHKELRDRLEHGWITPDTNLSQNGHHTHDSPSFYTVKQFLERLNYLWDVLVDPKVIATLDTALRLRNLGHWSIVLGPEVSPAADIKDCRYRRAKLFKQNPGRKEQNQRFLDTTGLMDVFENSMSGPMICMLVDDLHSKAMREKVAFYEFVTDKINTARTMRLDHRRTQSEPEVLLGGRKSTFVEAKVDLQYAAEKSSDQLFTRPELGPLPERKKELVADMRSLQPRTRRAESLGYVVVKHVKDMPPSMMQRRRGPRQEYSLNLYSTNLQPGKPPQVTSTWSTQDGDSHRHIEAGPVPGDMVSTTAALHKIGPQPDELGTPAATPPDQQSNFSLQRSPNQDMSTRYFSQKTVFTGKDETWTASRNELYALIDKCPKLVTPPRVASKKCGGSSFNILGLQLGKRRRG